MNEYLKLLKDWCDRLVDLQIKDIKDPTIYGGIICPACSHIHGRIADAVYPMVLLYHKLGDEKYLSCAQRLFDWSEHNLLFDGGYNNDKLNGWRATSVFTAIALGDTLLHHKECLDSETCDKWTKIFIRLTEFVYELFGSEQFGANINYRMSEPCLMAMAYLLTDDIRYKIRADEGGAFAKRYFNNENLLFGESGGYPMDKVTAKGCNYVDMGYNAEESLPALIQYASLLSNNEDLKFFADKFKAHIEFMLPDGAWDNSFGTRACKWTYWGSRTSDGCQSGLVYLQGLDDVFSEAAQRNFELYRKCTKNGLLYGGKMYIEAGEEPCVLHTFCHAKALAKMIDCGFEHKAHVKLPRERQYGLKHFKTVGARLVSFGDWTATISDTDAVAYRGAAVSGGALSLLYHKKAGTIFASSMNRYNRMIEATNMQRTRNWENSSCATVRLQNGEFSSDNDIYAVCSHSITDEKIEITAKGTLRDCDYNGKGEYAFSYTFCSGKVLIEICSDGNATVKVPIAAAEGELERISDTHFELTRNGTKIHITSDCPMSIGNSEFSLIGGFELIPLTAFGNKKLIIEVAVL